MITGAFVLFSLLLAIVVFLYRSIFVALLLTGLYIAGEVAFTLYALTHLNLPDGELFSFDAAGVLFTVILAILSISTYYHSLLFLSRHSNNAGQISTYFSSLILLITAMISSYMASNLALMWASIEATTLFVSFLIYHERSREAIEASWKYLYVSSVGVAIAFMGILLISIASSPLHSLNLEVLRQNIAHIDNYWLKIAFLLILTGFSAKMGFFPLHTVAVDAHTVAPAPISAFISTTLMNVGFIGVFRVFSLIAHTSVLTWARHVMLVAGILSIVLAAIQLLQIKHLKRMFAFSSLEHMGIVLLGLGAGGLGYYAALLQIVFHSLVKASLFYQAGQINAYYHSYYLNNIRNYFKLNPVGSLSLIFGVIFILAVPPTGLFFSEIFIFIALFRSGYSAIAFIALLLIVFIIYVFISNLLKILFRSEEITSAALDGNIPNGVENPIYETISQFLLLGITVYTVIAQPPFWDGLLKNIVSQLSLF